MATTDRHIETDRGLSSRMFFTGLALVLLYVVVIGILISVGVSIGFVLVIGFAAIFSQYWSRTALRCSRCTPRS